MKRMLAMILTMVMLLSLLGCGQTPDSQPTDPSLSCEGPRGIVPLKIGIWDEGKDYDTNALTRWLEEQCDCDLSFHLYHEAEYQVRQTLADVEIPDIIYQFSCEQAEAASYVDDGYLLDLTAYFDDREGASKIFWDRIEKELTPEQQKYVLQTMTNAETGRIYSVPTVSVYRRNHRPWINQVLMDRLDLEMPQNPQELYNVLVAFKEMGAAEDRQILPLMGSQTASGSAHVIDWLINMFIYYDPDNLWQDYDGDGQLELVYTQEEYREALEFIHQMVEDELLFQSNYVFTNKELRQMISTGEYHMDCGIFLGDLSTHVAENSENIYDYVPLPLWGNAVEESIYCSMGAVISGDCQDPDRAFELLMTLWSWEGSTRAAYGEYGKHWDYADPGTLNIWGMEATWKQIAPVGETDNAHWERWSSGIYYKDGGIPAQTQQVPAEDPWKQRVAEMNQEANRLFAQAAEQNNFQACGPWLRYTPEARDSVSGIAAAIETAAERWQKRFVCEYISGHENAAPEGIYDDAQWEAYLQELQELGLEEWSRYVQEAWQK